MLTNGRVTIRFGVFSFATICVFEIGVDRSIVVLTIAEHVVRYDPVAVEMFALHTGYHSGTYIHI